VFLVTGSAQLCDNDPHLNLAALAIDDDRFSGQRLYCAICGISRVAGSRPGSLIGSFVENMW